MSILFSFLYAISIGLYSTSKKFALRKSSPTTVLVIFSTTIMLLCLMWIPFGVAVPVNIFFLLALKGIIIAISWYLVLSVLKTVDLSIVSLTSVISVVLTFLAGIILFKENITVFQVFGSILVLTGVVLINTTNKGPKRTALTAKQFIFLILSALINSTSSIIDKYTTQFVGAKQVQFWFILFVFLTTIVMFSISCIKERKFLIKKTDLKNVFIYSQSIFLFLGDLCLFTAYTFKNSNLIVITIISKFQIVVTVLLGIILLKEKDVKRKLLLLLLIITGILLVALC